MLKQITTSLAVALITTSASAGATYGFTHLYEAGDGPSQLADGAIGEAQFSVEVIEESAGFVRFKFTNSGPDDSSMVQLYWEDTTNVLSSLQNWSTSTPSGVDFSGGSASPGHLPGSSPKIDDFSIQPKSQGGKSKNGVGPNEDVTVRFLYSNSYFDVLEAMDNGDLLVGVHAQSFAGGGSESFVTTGTPEPPTGIPSPSAALAGAALMGLLVNRRRRRN